jgi:nicotinamidase/pyrazinamidase
VSSIHWDIDTQIDFIHAAGRLAVPGAEAILPNLQRLTAHAHATGTRIVATADDHDLGHAEISDAPDWTSTFPPHCMRGTRGQEKVPETALRAAFVVHSVPWDAAALTTAMQAADGDILINKPGTDVFRWNPNAAVVLHALAPTRIIAYGVATDICVLAAVNGLRRLRPEAEVVVVTDAIAALDPARGEALVREWAATGCTLATTAQLTG